MNFFKRFQSTATNSTIGGRYKLVDQLGVGGFSQTFLAEDLHLPGHPRCVVKQLKPQVTDVRHLQTAQRLFETEAKVLYQLGNHDQIPRLLAHFTDGEEFYLVQELVEGEPLSKKLAAGFPWTERRVVQLLHDLMQILDFVHAQNVIHRDIKPSNLICRTDGKIVLIDFGAVKQVSQQPTEAVIGYTQTVSVGTHGYMPVEQLGGHPRFSSDLYAAGMVAIQALTGTHPKAIDRDPQSGEVDWRKPGKTQQSHRLIWVSPELGKILDRMVAYHFRDRYESARAVLQDLEALPLGEETSLEDTPFEDAVTVFVPATGFVEAGEDTASESEEESEEEIDQTSVDLFSPQEELQIRLEASPLIADDPSEPYITDLFPNGNFSDNNFSGNDFSGDDFSGNDFSDNAIEIGWDANQNVNLPDLDSNIATPESDRPLRNERAEREIGEATALESPHLDNLESLPLGLEPKTAEPSTPEPDSDRSLESNLEQESAHEIEPDLQTSKIAPETSSPVPSITPAVATIALSVPPTIITDANTSDPTKLEDPSTAQSTAFLAPLSPPQTSVDLANPAQPRHSKRFRLSPTVGMLTLGAGVLGIGLLSIATIALFTNLTNPESSSPTVPEALSLPCNEPPIPELPPEPDHTFEGVQYYGEWANGRPADGRGIMVFPSGNRYDGEFQNGKRNGCGTQTYTNGRQYVGQFVDDAFNGQGIWTLENGDRYIGMFQDNRCQGEGVFIFADGTLQRGIWEDGNLVGEDLSCDRPRGE